MKAIKFFLKSVLFFVVVVTGYYTIVRYFINDNQKGINPNDLVNICLFLIIPISMILFVIKKKK